MKINQVLRSLLVTIFLFPLVKGQAQDTKELLQELAREDSSTIEALVMYPAEIRKSIAIASQEPTGLVRVHSLQGKTQEKFQGFMKGFDREEAEAIYDLTRYPGLIDALIQGGKKSNSEIEEILKEYPEDVHENAKKVGRSQYDALATIKAMEKEARDAFGNIIKDYTPEVQDAFKDLVENPEVLSLLTQNINLTIVIGEVYKEDPQWLKERSDKLAADIARQNAEELEAFKKGLEEDPEAYEEMMQQARDYAKENGMNVTEIEDVQQQNASKPQTNVTVNVSYNPYPYWFGYPYWYSTPYWRPYPYWYHTGFYFGPGGGMVWVGMPSYHYMAWHHNYAYRYPHCNSYYNYHYRNYANRYPRSSYNRAYQSVNRTPRTPNSRTNRPPTTGTRPGGSNRPSSGTSRPPSTGSRPGTTQPSTGRPDAGQRPSTGKPSTRPTQPSTRPTQPSTRPTQPSTRPTQPSTRPTQPSTRPTQPSTRPTQPSTRPTQPSTRPSTGSYQQHRANSYHQSNWNSRPSTPSYNSRPSGGYSQPSGSRPMPSSRPAAGGGRRR